MDEQETSLKEVQSNGNFEIKPIEKKIDFSKGYTQLEMNTEQKKHVSALIQNIPSLIAVNTLAETYIVKFPDGLQHTLMSLGQGGFSSTYIESGKIAGTASLYSTATQAAVLGAFTTMSIVSGQYFLSQINSELRVMKLNIDKILEFLYGEKKAELMSEVSFVKYAYQNYGSIMGCNPQRIATISSLQNARKVAMKDIEFYVSDLDSIVNGKDGSDVGTLTEKAMQIKESLELSMQLYGMSSVLEIYYAQNHESSYIKYIDSEITSYIDKCEKRMLSIFSILKNRISEYKGSLLKKIDKTAYERTVVELIESLNSGEESLLRKSFRESLWAASRTTEYYVDCDGEIYLKAS